jgi:hypothetical protein
MARSWLARIDLVLRAAIWYGLFDNPEGHSQHRSAAHGDPEQMCLED